ncbi:hypothetical protein M8J76_011939 [Diaphorina citri]|nr:hypothetical protein M8J75_002030 [Diaphorina citri]KAI5722678.1 hypothetical protein M8J76_011939 [Diaphorina citri]KAI5724586.1 hypothetical protein M8J77_004556 [Diaphorina citri]
MSSSPDTDRFKTNDLAMRVQKKLASKMSNKSMVKMYIDDRSGRLLDNLYRVIKTYTNNKKQSEKIIKTLIKIIIKTTLLVKNHQFSSTELTTCETLKAKFHTLLMSLISFYEVDFSYDAAYLIRQLTTLRSQLAGLLQRHLTSKNLTNLDNLFAFVSQKPFLDAIFDKSDERFRPAMSRVVADLNILLDGGGGK